MIFRVLFFVSVFLTYLSSSENSENYSISPAPSWVKIYDCPLTPIPVDESQVHLQCLHSDVQRYWEEKTTYYRQVYKTLTQTGVENISQIRIDFTPAFEKVLVHQIRIFRNGLPFDRLQNAQYKLIQRESGLEDLLFDGSLSLVYFLNDIREGDIIEYAFSVVGENPIFDSHCTGHVNLQKRSSAERMSYRLLTNPSCLLSIKPVNIDIQPEIVDLSPDVREWTWEVCQTLPDQYESDEPYWYDPHAFVRISEYSSWKEIISKIVPFYTLPDNFEELAPNSMKDLVQQWKKNSEDPEKWALQALRFVQDEIRYLGMEEGIGAVVPSSPVTVFERRFGDCKDKSFLLHGLLKLMNISSTPLLVHTSQGRFLREIPPVPFAFNHAVLQIDLGGETYFVDPTHSLQGGTLRTNSFPNYKMALPIKDSAADLISIDETPLKKPTEIHSFFTQISGNTLSLKLVFKFYDSSADIIRQILNQKGVTQLEKEEVADIQRHYKKVKINEPLKVVDDRELNVLSLEGSYTLTTQKEITSKRYPFISFVMENYLDDEFDSERLSPYALFYPLWVKESIHLEKQGAGWVPLNDSFFKEHESFAFSQKASINENVADFHIELHHLQDHVAIESFEAYLEEMDAILEKEPSELLFSK